MFPLGVHTLLKRLLLGGLTCHLHGSKLSAGFNDVLPGLLCLLCTDRRGRGFGAGTRVCVRDLVCIIYSDFGFSALPYLIH